MNSIDLSRLSPAPGSNHRKKIVGRGVGSGHGRHATRGMKGQRSRRGDSKMIGFEGGQMPLLRRIPKRGFNVPFPKEYAILSCEFLDQHFEANSPVTPDSLRDKGFLKGRAPLKILGSGELTKPLQISAQACSEGAKKKIIAAGGSISIIPPSSNVAAGS